MGGGGEPQSYRLQWSSAFFKVKCPTKMPHCIQTVTKHNYVAKSMAYVCHQPVVWCFPARWLPVQANQWHSMDTQVSVDV